MTGKFGRLLPEDPSLIAVLVGEAVMNIVIDSTARIVRTNYEALGAIELAREIAPTIQQPLPIEAGLRGQAVFGCVMSRMLARGTRNIGDEDLRFIPKSFRLAQATESRHLAFCRELFVSVRQAKGDMRATAVALENLDRRIKSDGRSGSLAARGLVPSYAGLGWAGVRTLARSRMLVQYAEIFAYYREHRHFPSSLESLKTKGLVDPYTSKPFLYRLNPGGFVLYSPGKNGRDDGGRVSSAAYDDVGFEYPFKARTRYEE